MTYTTFPEKYFLVVNVDWFFLSHRLPLALEMLRRGYQVYILTKDTGLRSDIEKKGLKFINIDFERSGKNPLKELNLIKVLRKIYKKHRPHIIHHVTIKPAIYGSIAAKSLKSAKIINAISGLGFNFIDNRDGLVQKVLRRLMRFAFSGNVNFIFQNPDDLQAYRKMGFLHDENFCLIKGSGVDAELFNYTAPIPNKRITITTTARMLYDKGIKELINAAIILKDKWEEKIQFILAGDIDMANPAGISEVELRASLIPGYIEWVGHHPDVKPLLIDSDIACLPSYREGLPKSLIEAMAIGRPIVSTDVPGCRECVDNGINGYLVPAKDAVALAHALEKLIENEDLRVKMGKQSRNKMLRELSLEKVLNDTVVFYDSI